MTKPRIATVVTRPLLSAGGAPQVSPPSSYASSAGGGGAAGHRWAAGGGALTPAAGGGSGRVTAGAAAMPEPVGMVVTVPQAGHLARRPAHSPFTGAGVAPPALGTFHFIGIVRNLVW